MDELLASLLAAAIQFSGLPPVETLPPVQAMPYQAMLNEICADERADVPMLLAQYRQCTERHRMMTTVCDGLKVEADRHDQCTQQRGLVAAYLIEQGRIVYRNDLDLDNDTDNSFLVHEYVHALQSQYFGKQVFETCQGVMTAEKQAYAVQQKYLRSRSQLLRVGDRLRLVTCRDID
ncbi:MAG TPA: hypothetical protein VN639_21040 [Azonexus sp.]|nr:hypothetical protein [Azonexus sp.]